MGIFSKLFSPQAYIAAGELGGGMLSGNPALLAAGASSLGGVMANDETATSAQKQMDFQSQMSSTAHQREVADLKAAGLNPLLSVNSGASTPSGSSYTAQDTLTPGVNSALAAKRLSADLDQLRAQTEKTKSDTITNSWANAKAKADIQNSTQKTASDVQLNRLLGSKAMADASLSATSARNVAAQAQLNNYQLPKARNQANVSKTKSGDFLDTLDKVISTFSPFGHSAAAISK